MIKPKTVRWADMPVETDEELNAELNVNEKYEETSAPAATLSDEEGEAEVEEVQDYGDVRTMRKMVDPKLPSKEDIEQHEMTHLPFRNWCRHCVRGRGVEASHRRAVRDVGAIPEIHLDFCFPGSTVGEDPLTVLVARDRDSRMTMSDVIPTKGSTGKFAAARTAAFIRELGYGAVPIILKSDQEPAIGALVNEIARIRAPAATQPEQSPVGSSASNGMVERAVQSFEMMARVMKDALEHKWAVSIPDDHAILTWLTGYASYLLNRFEVGQDGKTSYERLKGKKAKVCAIEFGEGVLFKIGKALQKKRQRW